MLTIPSSLGMVRLTPEPKPSEPQLNGANGKGPETPEIKTPQIKTPEWPDVTEEGEPKRTYSNARAAIVALGVACSYDLFHDRMLVAGHPINEWAGELTDTVNVMLRQIIINKFGLDPGKENIADAATELCLENRFDPIVDYLAGLKWDRTPRLDRWLTDYLGAEDTPLNQAIGQLTLVAAVRRARTPGCKFDHILTFEGKMKSTSILTLAGVENFSDQTILTASDKEQQELVRGVWIFEIADLAECAGARSRRSKPSPAARMTGRDRPMVAAVSMHQGAASLSPPPTRTNTCKARPATGASGRSRPAPSTSTPYVATVTSYGPLITRMRNVKIIFQRAIMKKQKRIYSLMKRISRI